MKKVEISIMKRWLDENGPDGVSKLAIGSGISSSTIRRIRSGYFPKKMSTRRQVAQFMRVAESKLFPGSGEAS